jgi:hypothetical protein
MSLAPCLWARRCSQGGVSAREMHEHTSVFDCPPPHTHKQHFCVPVSVCRFARQEDAEWLEAAMVGNEARMQNASPWVLRLRLSYNVKVEKDIQFKEIVKMVRGGRSSGNWGACACVLFVLVCKAAHVGEWVGALCT